MGVHGPTGHGQAAEEGRRVTAPEIAFADPARRRMARAVIRFARSDADRDFLLNVLGLTYEDACPVPNAGHAPAAELDGPGATGMSIVLENPAPVVPRRKSPDKKHPSPPLEGDRFCKGCRTVKAASAFYPGRGQCKACHQHVNSEAQRARKAREPKRKNKGGRPPLPRVDVTEKLCVSCRTFRDAEEFSADKRRPDALFSSCKECVISRRRKTASGRKAVSA